jgi:hypothetical protein
MEILKRDAHGFFRRPYGVRRDETAARIAAAKGTIAAVHPRHTASLLEFASEGAARARQATLRQKPRHRGPAESEPVKGPSDAQQTLINAAQAALAALPRQSQRDEVVTWANEHQIGYRDGS